MHQFQSDESRDIAKCDDVTSSKLQMIRPEDKKIDDPSVANNTISPTPSGQEDQESGSMAHDEHVSLIEDEQSNISNKQEDNVFMLARSKLKKVSKDSNNDNSSECKFGHDRNVNEQFDEIDEESLTKNNNKYSQGGDKKEHEGKRIAPPKNVEPIISGKLVQITLI